MASVLPVALSAFSNSHAESGDKPRLKRDRTRGAALVELVLVLMLLILLTFGVMEYGWMFSRIQEVTNAARAGARRAVVPDATSEQVTAAISAQLDPVGITGYSIVLAPTDVTTPDVGELVTVTVSVPYSNVELLGMPIFPTPELLRASVSMAKEGS